MERAVATRPRDDSSERSVWATATLAALDGQQCDAQAQPDLIVERNERLARVERRMRNEVLGMDFGFLFDQHAGCCRSATRPTRNVSTSCYDLLASEARVASYVAIAKGDVQTRHWFRLGRTVTPVLRRRTHLLVRLDVRVPDAAARDAITGRQPVGAHG